MKRFRRWLFNGLATLSLLLFMMAAAVWVRSYFVFDHIANAIPSGKLDVIHSSRGMLFIEHRAHWEMEHYTYTPGWNWDTRPLNTRYNFAWSDYPGYPFRGVFGFTFFKGMEYLWRGASLPPPTNLNDPGFQRESFTALFLPDWALVTIFGIGPVWLGFQIRHSLQAARRARRHACLRCGYDLRATPERCPECGTVPAKKEATT